MRLIDADALIDRLDYCVKEGMGSTIAFTFKHMVEEAPTIDIPHSDDWEKYSERLWKTAYERGKADRPSGEWIEVKWHEITDEEREKEGYPKDWIIYIDCQMPADEERILIQTRWGTIELDEAQIDGEMYLDSGYSWADDVVAWMPLPKPWKGADDERKDIQSTDE